MLLLNACIEDIAVQDEIAPDVQLAADAIPYGGEGQNAERDPFTDGDFVDDCKCFLSIKSVDGLTVDLGWSLINVEFGDDTNENWEIIGLDQTWRFPNSTTYQNLPSPALPLSPAAYEATMFYVTTGPSPSSDFAINAVVECYFDSPRDGVLLASIEEYSFAPPSWTQLGNTSYAAVIASFGCFDIDDSQEEDDPLMP